MTEAFICDASAPRSAATAGALSSSVRADDLAAIPIKALIDRNPKRRLGRARRRHPRLRQPGRRGQSQPRAHGRAARRPARQLGRRDAQPPVRLGLDAVAMAARAIRGGEADLIIAGGSESMSRAPFVMPKATSAFDRNAEIYDTTIGWRFVNPKMRDAYGDDTMPSTAENVAEEFRSAARTRTPSRCAARRRPPRRRPTAGSPPRSSRSTIPQRKGDPVVVDATSIRA
jgi:acetyl-CoA acetyltransferase